MPFKAASDLLSIAPVASLFSLRLITSSGLGARAVILEAPVKREDAAGLKPPALVSPAPLSTTNLSYLSISAADLTKLFPKRFAANVVFPEPAGP